MSASTLTGRSDRSPAAFRPLVVGIGEILWDLLPTGKQMGGAPANFAYQARALGAESRIVSAVGDDVEGREILDALAARRLDRRHIAIVPAVPTGTVTVGLDDEGIPRYAIRDNVAWDALPWTADLSRLAAEADAVCYGTLAQRHSLTRATVRSFLEATRPSCVTVLDLNLRQTYYSPEIVHGLLGRSRVLKLNEEELLEIARLFSISGTETDLLVSLRDIFSLELIALTKGKKGSRLLGRDGDSVHPGFPVDVADTVGAGDAFTAALVMGLLKHKNLDEINARANRVASFVCSHPGAWPELPAEFMDGA
jgi:fructokinase